MTTRDRSGPRLDSVEDFARLSARLAKPFADRASILADVHIDETQWEEIRRFFHAELERAAAAAAPETAPACVRYRDAFTAALNGDNEGMAQGGAANTAPGAAAMSGAAASSPAPASPAAESSYDLAPRPDPIVIRAVPAGGGSHMLGLGADGHADDQRPDPSARQSHRLNLSPSKYRASCASAPLSPSPPPSPRS